MLLVGFINKLPTKWNSVVQKCMPNCKRFYSENLDVNTSVAKDVILYKYENPRIFKLLNIFAFCQFGFWTYLSLFSYQTLRDVPVSKDENASWYRRINLGDNKYRYAITASAFLIGELLKQTKKTL